MHIEYKEESLLMSELCSLSNVYRKLKTNVVFLQSNTKPEGVYWIHEKSYPMSELHSLCNVYKTLKANVLFAK